MKSNVVIFVSIALLSQMAAAWICFIGGTKYFTADAGAIFGIALFLGFIFSGIIVVCRD